MHRQMLTAAAIAVTLGFPIAARAEPVYIALGDSITFGETDLSYAPSAGDRGYVSLFADHLAGQNGGVRPSVVNLAIDGETADSFMDGTGRTPPVVSRTDAILAAQNTHYDINALVPQRDLFLSTVAQAKAAGDTIDTVSISLGFNELAALATAPNGADQIASTLATYRDNYDHVLDTIRDELPDADLFVLNYFNPFPADPSSPAAPIFAAGGPPLNAIIEQLAADHGGRYVDTFTPFVGHEAAYTYLNEMPAGSGVADPFGGVLPIGNVHPNAEGYAAIAGAVEAAATSNVVPEPSSVALLGMGAVLLLRRRVRA